MGKLLGKDTSDITIKWKEWHIQAYIVQESHRAGHVFAAGMEGNDLSKSGRGKADATGRTAGEPDLRYYMPGGRLIMIELKLGESKLQKSQKKRIPILRDLGFEVHLVRAVTPEDGWAQVRELLL